ncbi:hypothetical protein QA052_gp23 [Salmonella phage MET_P1_001_43]|uniref:Uncharacterized protein n=1 Tax=Salmonella phage MET_P1_001_43 TaxID=2982923 RepID=A0A9E8LRA1_9CAUD|nr:hypothetical protein QA052_gp23 [Salmonella phage MET_P1_001_43]UZZ64609.1 hypothetical protein [Salmonella phage MET_P1_001_43]
MTSKKRPRKGLFFYRDDKEPDLNDTHVRS